MSVAKQRSILKESVAMVTDTHSPNVRSSGTIDTLSVYRLLGWEMIMIWACERREGVRKWRGITSPQCRGKGSAPSGAAAGGP